MFRTLTAFLFLVQTPAPPNEAASIVRAALAAHEADSSDALAGRWQRDRGPQERLRAATLGLASLKALDADYRGSDSLYHLLLDPATPLDGYRRHAALGLAATLRIRGRIAEARALFDTAFNGARSAGDPAAEVQAGLALVEIDAGAGRGADALERLARLPVDRVTDSPLLAHYRCRRGGLMFAVDPKAGLDLLRSGARLARDGGHRRAEATCLMGEGRWHSAAGRVAQAGPLYLRAIALSREARDRPATAVGLQWLGFLYNSVSNLGAAYRSLREAAALSEAVEYPLVQGYTYLNLGIVSDALGDRVSALEYLDLARARMNSVADEAGLRSVDYAVNRVRVPLVGEAAAPIAPAPTFDGRLVYHRQLARLAALRENWTEALAEYQLALAQTRVPGLAQYGPGIYPEIAHAALRVGDTDLAARTLMASAAFHEQPARNYARMLLWAELYARTGRLNNAIDSMVSAEQTLRRFRLGLPTNDLRLFSQQATGVSGDPDLGAATIIARLAGAGRVAAAFRIADGRRSRELWDRLRKVRALQEDSTRPAPEPILDQEPVTLEAVRQVLPNVRSALLEYVTGRGGEPTTLFVATRDSAWAIALAPIDSLKERLSAFLVLLEDGEDVADLARVLGRDLLGAALDHLGPEIDHLVVVPDDIIHRIPLDALTDQSGRPLVERFAIDVVPSATVYGTIRGRPPPRGRGVLALGNPVLTAGIAEGPARLTSFVARLRPLPASRGEARRVARFGRPGKALTGEAATEAALKQTALGDYLVIHLATHAVVDQQTALRSALVLSPGGGDDGLVLPGELSQLGLDAALVVLAACRTGGGVLIGGEGVWGLTGPLLEAGARAVVATEWDVDDRAAAQFQRWLYQALARGEPPSTALQSAKRAAIRAGAPPQTWAAYTLFGAGTDPIVLAGPGPFDRRTALAALGAVGLGLLAYGLMRKRRTSDRVEVPSRK